MKPEQRETQNGQQKAKKLCVCLNSKNNQMKNLIRFYFGWLEGIISREMDVQEENTASVWRISLEFNISESASIKMNKSLTGPIIVACHWKASFC